MTRLLDNQATQAIDRVNTFQQRYGYDALLLACHAAFPIAVSSDLLYCLRESFDDLSDCQWYHIGDILLSPLCRTVGHDLYAMQTATRDRLLLKLQSLYGEAKFANRLQELQDFLLAYVDDRLSLDALKYPQRPSQRAKALGTQPHWTVLAYTQPTQAIAQIRQELQQRWQNGNQGNQMFMLTEVEVISEVLRERGYSTPVIENWADRVANGQPIPNSQEDIATELAKRLGVTLTPFNFEIEEIELTQTTTTEPEESLQPFKFTIVTVNSQGRETLRQEKEAYQFIEWLGEGQNRLPLEMVAIPSGEFWMGSLKTEAGRFDDEDERHLVTIKQPFFIGKYPITQAQWRFIVNNQAKSDPDLGLDLEPDPATFKGDDRPVENIRWKAAKEFCARLSAYTGRTYTLPSEAEWEYACRADTTTPFHFGETITPELANYDWDYTYGDYRKKKQKDFQGTTPVGQFKFANPFGLYDMHGNVWEWCEDHWHKKYDENAPRDGSAWIDPDQNENDYHLVRGGSWISVPVFCRSASRVRLSLDGSDDGFRVVCRA